MSVTLKLLVALLALSVLTACQDNDATDSPPAVATLAGTPFEDLAGTVTQATIIAPTLTPIPPSPTPVIPRAAIVNGEPIYLPTLEQAVAERDKGFYGVLDPELSDEEISAAILDVLIEQILIQQAASASSISVTEEMIAAEGAELRRLAEESGGAGAYETWLQTMGWTEAELESVVAQQLLLDQMVALVTVDVPEAAPHAHARYLQVDDAALADSLQTQLEAGADFAALAREHSLDRATGEDGGDLGYFAAGTLLVPELEAAAFALAPGETSSVIVVTNPASGQITYYLVQLIELDPARPLGADARSALLQERFEAWLDTLWNSADIQLYPEDVS